MPVRTLTALAVVVAVVAGAALLAAGPGPAPSPRAQAEPSPSGPALPTPPPLPECWVPLGTGDVNLTYDQARELTTVAARGRRGPLLRGVADLPGLTATERDRLAASLLGDRSTPRLSCAHTRSAVEEEQPGPSGLTPRARRLKAAWTEVFGPLTAGGFARGGVRTGHLAGSAHYEGRAIDVFFRPYTDPEQRRAGRVFAQWLVAHAQEHAVLSVIYADQIWTSWSSYAGWSDYEHPSGDTRSPVLRHLDHVHVAVESGSPWTG